MSHIDAAVFEGPNEWARNVVTLMVRQAAPNGAGSYLMGDGTWKTVEEGELPPDGAGLVLPASAVEPIARAIAEFQGFTSHTATEVRVLREWLTVEQRRVDEALRPIKEVSP